LPTAQKLATLLVLHWARLTEWPLELMLAMPKVLQWA